MAVAPKLSISMKKNDLKTNKKDKFKVIRSMMAEILINYNYVRKRETTSK